MNRNGNVVVGVDLGCTGDDALVEGLLLLEGGIAKTLHLLFVIDPRESGAGSGEAFESEERVLANVPARMEQRALTLARVFDIRVPADRLRGHARIGDTAQTLLQMCVDYDADLLVVGTHGRTGLDRWLDGSVAEGVIRRARCPVIVARRKDYSGATKTVLPDLPYAPGEAPQRAERREAHTLESTTLDSWHPADNGPTGVRIV